MSDSMYQACCTCAIAHCPQLQQAYVSECTTEQCDIELHQVVQDRACATKLAVQAVTYIVRITAIRMQKAAP